MTGIAFRILGFAVLVVIAACGVTFLITLYFQLAQVMATMDLETEEPFVGWKVS